MLYSVTDLSENAFGNVGGVLCDKPNADALGANKSNDLLNFVNQCFGCVVEQEMSFVKEERKLGLFKVAGFGEHFIDLGEHPQKERSVEKRVLEKLGAFEDIHYTAAVVCPVHPI